MKIWCCLCSFRTDKSSDRKSIGAASVWSLIELHVTKNGLDLTRLSSKDYICNKCYALISHPRMTDRGANKQVKIHKPVVVETIINKTVLRGYKPPEVAVSNSSASVKGAVNEEDTTLLTSSVRNSLRITKPNDFQEDSLLLSNVSDEGIHYSSNSYHTQGSKVLLSLSSGVAAENEESAEQNVVDEAVVSHSELPLETEA